MSIFDIQSNLDCCLVELVSKLVTWHPSNKSNRVSCLSQTQAALVHYTKNPATRSTPAETNKPRCSSKQRLNTCDPEILRRISSSSRQSRELVVKLGSHPLSPLPSRSARRIQSDCGHPGRYPGKTGWLCAFLSPCI